MISLRMNYCIKHEKGFHMSVFILMWWLLLCQVFHVNVMPYICYKIDLLSSITSKSPCCWITNHHDHVTKVKKSYSWVRLNTNAKYRYSWQFTWIFFASNMSVTAFLLQIQFPISYIYYVFYSILILIQISGTYMKFVYVYDRVQITKFADI